MFPADFISGSRDFTQHLNSGELILIHFSQSTHAITNLHASAGGHCNDAYLDRSCSTLIQRRTVKLSKTDFGYFSCNP